MASSATPACPLQDHHGELSNDEGLQHLARAQSVFAVLLVAWSAVIAVRQFRQVDWRAFRAKLRKASLLACLRLHEDSKVVQIADAQHLDFWRWVFQLWVPLCGGGLSIALIVWLVQGEAMRAQLLSGPMCPDTLMDVLGGIRAPLTYALFSGLIFVTFPALLTKRAVYCWICLTYVWIEWRVVLSREMHILQFYSLSKYIGLVQVLLSMHCTDARFVIVVNLLFCGVYGYHAVERFGEFNAASKPTRSLLYWETAVFALILIIYLLHRRMLLQQIRATLAVKSSRNVESSCERLLRGMCDVVVHLKSDLTLKQQSPQLNAMLLRFPPARATSGGEAFLDFVYDDADKERFRAVLQPEEAVSGGLPDTLHVGLRDAYQTRVPVQLFFTSYLDAMDEVFYLIGIQEQTSNEPRHPRETRPEDVPVQTAVEVAVADRSMPSISSLASSSATGESQVRAVLPQLSPDSGCEADEVAVWIDPYEDGLPMMHCSPAFFTNVGGPSLKKGAMLMSWVPKRKRCELHEHVQTRVNELLYFPDSAHTNFQVCLQPRHMPKHRIHMCLTLTSLEMDADDAGAKSEQTLCKVTCTQLKHETSSSIERNVQDEREATAGAGAGHGGRVLKL